MWCSTATGWWSNGGRLAGEPQSAAPTARGHRYYFPCGSKTLPLSALRAVGSAGGLNPLWNHKLWGMAADFAVWWAKGTIGGKKRMVADSGVWPKVGFCCDDPAELLRQLDALLQ